MSHQIKDGSGDGYLAKVDSRHNLWTQCRNIQESRFACAEGQMVIASTPIYTITATGGRVLWLDWTETNKSLVIDRFFFHWNGGDTNHDRVAFVSFAVGDTQPTTGTTASALVNTNTSSSVTHSSTLLVWNGSTGDGMTGHTPGVVISTLQLRQGCTHIPVDGIFIFGPSSKLSINVNGEETGKFSMSGYGYCMDLSESNI